MKVDWALDRPIPWTAASARRAGVIHVADGVDELTLGAAQIATGMVPASPFLVVGQYAPVDETRSPRGTDVAWAYTQVPATVRGDAAGEGIAGAWRDGDGDGERLAARIEQRIETLAPGFGALIRARHILTPPDFERIDRNLVAGSMHGGTTQLHQQAISRPTASLGRPETPVARLFSPPPRRTRAAAYTAVPGASRREPRWPPSGAGGSPRHRGAHASRRHRPAVRRTTADAPPHRRGVPSQRATRGRPPASARRG